MSHPFPTRLKFMALLGAALSCYSLAGETDPIPRQYLRSIDEPARRDNSGSLQRTMDQLNRGDIPLPSEFENLFPQRDFSPPGEFRGAELRTWRDNTGTYEVEGRLTVIFPEKVRLLKTNGRTTTVPMQRLSPTDQAYVRWVVEQLARSERTANEFDNHDLGIYPAR